MDQAPATTYSSKLDPAAEKVLLEMKAQGYPGLAYLRIPEFRALMGELRQLAGDPEPVARVENTHVPGNPDIPVRVYLPDAPAPMPVVVYFHGGDWIAGDCDIVDSPLRTLANRSGCAVVSVAYRLAPEHKYPAAHDDCFAAVQWAAAHGDRYGWDGRRLAVAGDSVGGTLAAAMALRARDEGGPPIRLQVLVYPVLDHDYDTESYRQFGSSWGVITRTDIQWGYCHYLSHPSQLDLPYVCPSRSTDLSGVAEALLIAAETDPLLDEGLRYAQHLRQAGVAVEVKVYTGMFHGFWQMGGALSQAHRALEKVAATLRSRLSESSVAHTAG